MKGRPTLTGERTRIQTPIRTLRPQKQSIVKEFEISGAFRATTATINLSQA